MSSAMQGSVQSSALADPGIKFWRHAQLPPLIFVPQSRPFPSPPLLYFYTPLSHPTLPFNLRPLSWICPGFDIL